MPKVKAPWHKGTHQARAKRITDAANRDPNTRCWRCDKTLAEHQPHKTGKPARWTAGHVIDGLIDGPLAPEASTCNFSAGATAGNAQRRTRRTALTW